MSVSSLRVDAIKPEIVKTLVAAGQKNVTLAIEAGSERLRKLINKNLTEEQIFNAVKIAAENGLKGFKFSSFAISPTSNHILSESKRHSIVIVIYTIIPYYGVHSSLPLL